MNKTIEQMGVMSFLESLVGKRFTVEELKEYLKTNCDGFTVELVEKDMNDYDTWVDYMLVGSLQNKEKEILCGFDIYYTKTRNEEMYIVEVGYEFE